MLGKRPSRNAKSGDVFGQPRKQAQMFALENLIAGAGGAAHWGTGTGLRYTTWDDQEPRDPAKVMSSVSRVSLRYS